MADQDPTPKPVSAPGETGVIQPPQDAAPVLSSGENEEFAYLGESVEISTQMRLPHLDKGPAKAYAARSRGSNGAYTHFVLICDKAYTPRLKVIDSFSPIINPSLIKLVAGMNLYWPPAKGWRFALLYENRLGKKVMKSLDEQGLGWRMDHVMRAVIQPMLSVLQDMRDADVWHGDIRPTNMFESIDKGNERIILGEAISSPPSYTHDAIFEPVERAMCDPIAKGAGLPEDDLYSFGVSLVMLLRHRDPMHGKSREQIINEKINEGSYVALTGSERFSGAILELLRGLLHDDRNLRWDLDDVLAWSDGQRLSPKQNVKRVKASRPIDFNGERYYRPVKFAMDMHKNPNEAVNLFESGEIQNWIARSLDDAMVRNRIEAISEVNHDQSRNTDYIERLISKISMALDPDAPIRFKGMSLNPEGVGYALTEAVEKKKDIKPYIELINSQLVTQWVSAQTSMKLDFASIVAKFDNCRAYLKQTYMGYGFEKCVYTLNPNSACLSDALKNHNVTDIPGMMDAFEDISKLKDRPVLFIDRHIAAFISSKDRNDIDGYFGDLNAQEYHKRIMGNLKTLATIQHRGRMKPYPGICGWISDILDPVYERFHDRELRTKLKTKIQGLVEAGEISKIAMAIDNAEDFQADVAGFREAMVEYHELREELADLQQKLSDPVAFTKDTGNEFAAILSGIISGVIILILTFMFFFNRGG